MILLFIFSNICILHLKSNLASSDPSKTQEATEFVSPVQKLKMMHSPALIRPIAFSNATFHPCQAQVLSCQGPWQGSRTAVDQPCRSAEADHANPNKHRRDAVLGIHLCTCCMGSVDWRNGAGWRVWPAKGSASSRTSTTTTAATTGTAAAADYPSSAHVSTPQPQHQPDVWSTDTSSQAPVPNSLGQSVIMASIG